MLTRLIRALLIIFLTLVVPVLLVLISTRLLINDSYLSIEYHKADFPPDAYGFTLDDRLMYAPYALHYMLNDADIQYLGDLKFPDGKPFYNERELQHMADVKRVTQAAYNVVFPVLLLLFAGAIVMLLSSADRRVTLRQGLFGGGLLTIALIALLAIGVLVNWDTFFTQFHELFFSNGSWQFYYSDSLIRLYPVRFWQDAALTIGGLTIGGALILMAGSWLWARRVR